MMLNAQRRAGHVVNITSPISKQSTSQAGIVFVDDTNLWAGLDEDDDAKSAAYKAQQGVTNWGKLLIAGGGALQPAKCKWTVHNQVVKKDGTKRRLPKQISSSSGQLHSSISPFGMERNRAPTEQK